MVNIKPKKREGRNKWVITYRVPGYDKTFSESFSSEAEANMRAAEIRLRREQGTLRPPLKETPKKLLTLNEFLAKYVEDYGCTHWGDSQYGVVTKQFRDYVQPSELGKLLLKDIQTGDIDKFYNDLLDTPVVLRSGHKDTGKTVGISIIEKIHSSLRAALNQAVKWGYIKDNPANNATVPKMEHKERAVWSPEEAKRGVEQCSNGVLKICLLLAIACSMRIGEILGLQWDCVEVSEETIANNTSKLTVKQELKRCEKASLDAIRKHNAASIFFRFEERKVKNPCKTVLVLKAPKTNSSRRTIFIPRTVAMAILEWKAAQEQEKKKAAECYKDYNMVIAHPDGRPVEERYISKELDKLIEATGLPRVVFHSLRHLSTSMKLWLSGGDIKAVQGDTGHSQARMVMGVYGHTFEENRKHMAEMMENSFFAPAQTKEKKVPSVDNDDMALIEALLKEKPELKTVLLSMAGKST